MDSRAFRGWDTSKISETAARLLQKVQHVDIYVDIYLKASLSESLALLHANVHVLYD